MPTIYETDSLDEAIDIIQDKNKVIRCYHFYAWLSLAKVNVLKTLDRRKIKQSIIESITSLINIIICEDLIMHTSNYRKDDNIILFSSDIHLFYTNSILVHVKKNGQVII